ncbi:hypothetical protein Pla52n_45360 [Stieleria varia]|uniref:Uncharacterized protein n=1 Tax=Stieleria varia TaxID=2528005 RepID=A0A5C6ASJ4_9BACT|nr:hypothetical protein Pla52n_45360 [Stieleria varia]
MDDDSLAGIQFQRAFFLQTQFSTQGGGPTRYTRGKLTLGYVGRRLRRFSLSRFLSSVTTALSGWFEFWRMVVFVFDLESRTTIVARLSKSIACPAKRFAIH